ncbi:MAG: GxxExxY protein, partial [Pseudomonadota bacterium]
MNETSETGIERHGASDTQRQDALDSQRQDAKTPRRQGEPDHAVDDLARMIIGAAIQVHKALGPGFPESIYEEALCFELNQQGVVFERQCAISVSYKG